MTADPALPPRGWDVRLNSVPTYWHCEPGWEWRARPLADHLIWYVMDGIGLMRQGGSTWELHAGVCFVFTPGAQPHGTQDPDRRLVVFGMHFDPVDPGGHTPERPYELPPVGGHIVRDTVIFATL